MNKKNSKIPGFKNASEAADFWDTHDSTEYLSQTKPAHLDFPKPTHKVVVDLGDRQWRRLTRLASVRRRSYSSLLRQFIAERLAASQ